MPSPLSFDPYAELGVDHDADDVTITLAWKAALRVAHPDLAGPAGLERTKRLNAAREALLDRATRAAVAGPPRRHGAPEPGPTYTTPGSERAERRGPTRPAPEPPPPPSGAPSSAPPTTVDPFRVDLGPQTEAIRRLFEHALDLSVDERTRLAFITHGYTIDRLLKFLPPDLAARQALLDGALRVIIERASLDHLAGGWTGGGRWLRSYAHWLLLEAFLTEQLRDMPRGLEAMRWSLTGPWLAVAGKRRYGPHTDAVEELLARARTLTGAEGRRLARGWRRLDTDPLRPPWPRPPENVEPSEFEWGAGFDSEMTVEAAQKVPFPADLPPRDRWEFRQGIRLAAAAVAAGEPEDSALRRPWRDALAPPRRIRQRLRDLL